MDNPQWIIPYNGELPTKHIPTVPSPVESPGQAPAIFVSQVRSAKAAPLTGSGKVPRSATVPAVEAHLCLASGGGTWEILRIPEKKVGRRDFWVMKKRKNMEKIGDWTGFWTDAIETMTYSDCERLIHWFSRGRICFFRFYRDKGGMRLTKWCGWRRSHHGDI